MTCSYLLLPILYPFSASLQTLLSLIGPGMMQAKPSYFDFSMILLTRELEHAIVTACHRHAQGCLTAKAPAKMGPSCEHMHTQMPGLTLSQGTLQPFRFHNHMETQGLAEHGSTFGEGLPSAGGLFREGVSQAVSLLPPAACHGPHGMTWDPTFSFHIIAFGMIPSPHWLDLFGRLAEHFGTLPEAKGGPCSEGECTGTSGEDNRSAGGQQDAVTACSSFHNGHEYGTRLCDCRQRGAPRLRFTLIAFDVVTLVDGGKPIEMLAGEHLAQV